MKNWVTTTTTFLRCGVIVTLCFSASMAQDTTATASPHDTTTTALPGVEVELELEVIETHAEGVEHTMPEDSVVDGSVDSVASASPGEAVAGTTDSSMLDNGAVEGSTQEVELVGESTEDSEPSDEEATPAAADTSAGETQASALGAKGLELMAPVVKEHQKGAIAGVALFFSGAAIQYGLVLPEGSDIGPLDGMDQLALLGPSYLSIGLRVAGSTLGVLKTSDAAEMYEKKIGTDEPKNWAWYLYYSGYGFTVVSGAVGGMAMFLENETLTDLAMIPAVLADVVWGVAAVYSLIYVRRLPRAAARAASPKVSVYPTFDANGAGGLAVTLRF